MQTRDSDIDLTRRTMDDSQHDSDTSKRQPVQQKRSGALRDWTFRGYVIVSMTFVWSAYALTMRYTRTRHDRPMFTSSTLVVMSECTKFCLAALLLLREHQFSIPGAKQEFKSDFIGKPRELLKMAVPSVVYAIQNNLDIIALTNLDASVYQVSNVFIFGVKYEVHSNNYFTGFM
jgi:hypothetical protein